MVGSAAALARPAAASLGATVLRLELGEFRNYRALALAAAPGPLVLTGENGAGKTNLLEALSLLAPGRGLRRARLAELDRQGGGPWRLAAGVVGRHGRYDVLTARDPAAERRSVRLDGGAERGQQALAEILGVLWLTPADDRLFLAGPGDRRRFLDRLVLGVVPGHGAQVAAYERQLRERAALLREGRGDAAWLTVLERRIAEAAVAVAAARREVVAGLTAELDVMDQDLARPRLALAGEVEAELERLPALAAEQRLAERLRRARPADALMGGATHGPHRTDLLVADARSGQPAAQCSTGQQKALLVAILLAEARLRLARQGELPLLLLDEVAAHLDARRRAALFERLVALGAQAWLTGTDAALFAPLRGRAQFLSVHDATVSTA